MCSAPLDLISMLEKMPGFENMTDAMKGLNLTELGLNQSKATQPYGTIKRGEGLKGKNAAADPAKMFREVRSLKFYFFEYESFKGYNMLPLGFIPTDTLLFTLNSIIR